MVKLIAKGIGCASEIRSIDGQIALAPTLSFSLPKFKVIDPHNVRDQQPGDSDCGRKPSQGASEHKI